MGDRWATRSLAPIALGSIALMLVTRSARADEPQNEAGATHQKAAAAFVEARKLIEDGNCDAAVPKLEESLAYESSIGARLSIVDCTEQRDPLRAWRLLKEAAVLALMNHDERLAVIERRAAVLETRLGVVHFRLPPSAEQFGFELRVDGALVDRSLYRFPYATTPGRHEVEASAPRGQRFRGEVVTVVRQPAVIEVKLQREECVPLAPPAPAPPREAPTAAPPPSARQDERGGSRRTIALALGGAGLAGIATGVVFGILTFDRKGRLESACGGSTSACTAAQRSLDDQESAAKTTGTISTVGFAVGTAALLGGVALYLTVPSRSGQRTGVRVGPRGGRGSAGLSIESAF